MTKSEMRAFLDAVVSLRNVATDDQALVAAAAYPTWKADISYDAGARVLYNNVLYKVLTSHTSQANWAPDVAVSLFTKVLIPDASVIPEWEQPESTNPNMKGDKVVHEGVTYESAVDGNVWIPGAIGSETLWIAVQ